MASSYNFFLHISQLNNFGKHGLAPFFHTKKKTPNKISQLTKRSK